MRAYHDVICMPRHLAGWLAVCLGGAGLAALGGTALTLKAQQQAAAPSSNPAALPHVALVDKYCVACHDESMKKADLALDTIAKDPIAQHPDIWEKVVRKLNARQMPPVGRKERPDDA